MDDNRISGAAKRVVGHAEEAVADVTGNTAAEFSGRVHAFSGKAQQRVGEAADAVRGVAVKKPLTGLLTAGAVGLLAGLYLARR